MLPTKEWIALITGILGLAATVVAVIRYFIKKEQMEGDMKRLEERRKARRRELRRWHALDEWWREGK